MGSVMSKDRDDTPYRSSADLGKNEYRNRGAEEFGYPARVAPSQSQFTGLVISGSYDGRHFSANHPIVYWTEPPPEFAAYRPGDLVPKAVAVKSVAFKHVEVTCPCPPGTRGIAKKRHFWIPDDKDSAWALDQLIDAYIESR